MCRRVNVKCDYDEDGVLLSRTLRDHVSAVILAQEYMSLVL